MREDTITTKVYPFDELSDEAKQTAVETLCDINVDCDWWGCTYEDAKGIGLKITAFNLGYVAAEFIDGAEETAQLIVNNHGDSETAVDAIQYQIDRTALVDKHSDGVYTDQVSEDNEYDFDADCDELDAEFLKTICEDYRIILQKESEHMQSEGAIIETIEANDYEFTVDGQLY